MNITTIMEQINCVKMLADDLHYRSKGEAFYALHLLADRIRDSLKDYSDKFNECYFMGEVMSLPPKTRIIYENAIIMYKEIESEFPETADNSNGVLISRLMVALNNLKCGIEECSETNGLLSGSKAIIDSLSEDTLTAIALLNASKHE